MLDQMFLGKFINFKFVFLVYKDHRVRRAPNATNEFRRWTQFQI